MHRLVIALCAALLQWGPPGMGGVSTAGETVPSGTLSNFNGDLPEWEV